MHIPSAFPTPASPTAPAPGLQARRIALLALAMGVLVDVVIPGNAAGVNTVLVMAFLLGAAGVVAGWDGLRRMDPADAWLPAAALAFAAMPAVRADDWLVTVDLLLAAALGLGTIACLGGARITRGLVPSVLSTAVGLVAAVVVGAGTLLGRLRGRDGGLAGATTSTAHPAPASREPRTRRAVPAWLVRSVPVLRGLLIAVPVLALFALLFAAADAVFAELARTVLAIRVDIDFGSLVQRSVVISAVAWATAGLLAVSAGMLPALVPGGPEATRSRSSPAEPPHDGPPPPPWWTNRSLGAASVTELRHPIRLGPVEAATVLVLVDLLFAGFVALQLAYLFGGRDTMTVAGLTYAEYARRGFFELVAVAVLAVALVVFLDLVTASRRRVQLAASLGLLALTGLVLLSALLRLRLYQDMYGWTELRFVVLTAIVWLAVALGLTVWLLVARMTRWTLHVLGVLTLVVVAGMNVAGPQAFVAERNVERALNPAIVPAGGRTGLDVGYLSELGFEAVPAVVAAYPALPADARAAVDPFLHDRAWVLESDPSVQGWPSWNLARERARAALAGWPDPSRQGLGPLGLRGPGAAAAARTCRSGRGFAGSMMRPAAPAAPARARRPARGLGTTSGAAGSFAPPGDRVPSTTAKR
ncbi:MAG TPA: DUF4173 domain-containing protein [Candidatus Limnocylindrales bacterium]|nr:DUF4173 domain-containing protein [Candidatus Limnocylindrales bacterium]